MGVVRLPVITGPTATGKSALVAALASAAPLTVISADSRQLYRGFDIGTAKPTQEERALVPHAMIDVADPTERWNAARWADGAVQAIDAARAAGRVPVVVGGTGLYLRALFEPLFAEPELDPERRATLAAELELLPTTVLRDRVALIDPPRAHLGRTQLLRALEVAELTGHPITWWHAAAPRQTRFQAAYVVVQHQDLQQRIVQRVDAMLAAGWSDEVARLLEAVPRAAPAWNATGYEAVRELVDGARDYRSTREAVIVATRQYAKRQRTWFRHQLGDQVTHIELTEPGAMEGVRAWWDSVTA